MITNVNDLSAYVFEMDKIRNAQDEALSKISEDLIHEVQNLEEIEDERTPKIQKVQEILENEHFCNTITGFSIEEVTDLIEKSDGFFNKKGRGRKYMITEADLIVMFLHYLPSYPRFEEGAFLFGLNKSTYENYIESATQSALNCWYEKFVIIPGEHIDQLMMILMFLILWMPQFRSSMFQLGHLKQKKNIFQKNIQSIVSNHKLFVMCVDWQWI